jgi:hypothetical protein
VEGTISSLNFKSTSRWLTWSQSYDFGIYNYNASAVVGYIERFLKKKAKFFISKRKRRCNSKSIVSYNASVVKIYNASVVKFYNAIVKKFTMPLL